MDAYQKAQLEKAKQILEATYWDMADNNEPVKELNRLDTIIGKIEALQNLT